VEAGESSVSGYPVFAARRFEHIVDKAVWEAVSNREVSESRTVKKGDPLNRAKPQIPTRVTSDALNPIAYESVFGGENTNVGLAAEDRL
jgi:hypothetical protein